MASLPSLAGAAGPPVGAIPGLPIAGFVAGGAGLTSFYVIGFELGPWQEYLAQELTPDYMLAEDAQPVYVSWIGSGEVFLLPDFAAKLEETPEAWIKLNFEWQSSSGYARPGNGPVNGRINGPGSGAGPVYEGSSFERQYFAPGLERPFGEGGVLGVAAVIAYQRYSAANLGMFAASTPDLGPIAGYGAGYGPGYGPGLGLASAPHSGYEPFQESGFGTGVRLAVRQEVISGVALDAGFQSRIDMEEFAAYRGVYSQPADLDIPARARLGLAFQASERSWLNLAVERVLYSDISAFPSRFLPDRFLSMLGDSTSPSFNWEDLTVYTVGFAWSDGRMQEWHIDLSTRTQPSPSSRLLSQALAGDLSEGAMVVGYSRRTGDRSRLAFNAAYAPSEYAFGGSVLGVTTDELDRQLEVEAMWTLSF